MRYLWVDSPDNPWWEAIAANAITGLFFDPREGRTRANLELARSRGKAAGIFIGHAWGELGGTPESFVAKAKQWMGDLRQNNSFPKVQWDLEQHDPEFIVAVLKLWRKYLPWQETSWTLEGHQGGLFDGRPDLVKAIVECRVRIGPQLFDGDGAATPQEHWDPLAMTRDLTLRGFPDAIISPCYDAKWLPLWWSGYAFTQGRLPPP